MSAWNVKTDAEDEHNQRRDIWALVSNVQITTPEKYVCKLETRFGGQAVRNLVSALLCTRNRRNDGFTLEQDLELIKLCAFARAALVTERNYKWNQYGG